MRALDWLLHRPARRVAATAIFLGTVLVVFALRADVSQWLAFALGAVIPISLWIAWNGPHLYREPPRLEYFLAMTPSEFEHAVAQLIVPLGYRDVRVVGGAADLGVDVLCRDRRGRKVAVQVKRYQPSNTVSSSAVQTFMGGMVAHSADRGIIVTTSTFTGPARQLAHDHNIVLIDGTELTRILADEERTLQLN